MSVPRKLIFKTTVFHPTIIRVVVTESDGSVIQYLVYFCCWLEILKIILTGTSAHYNYRARGRVALPVAYSVDCAKTRS